MSGVSGGPKLVALVDDHPLLVAGLKALMEQVGLSVTVALPTDREATDREAIVAATVATRPDCVVVDLGLPIDGGGLTLLAPLATAGLRVIVLTGEDDVVLWASCVEAGAQVILSKTEDLDSVVTTIAQVAEGREVRVSQTQALQSQARVIADRRRRQLAPFAALSPREREILAALLTGLGPADIAARDYVSIQTVRTQVKVLLRKLSVSSQREAMAMATAAGWTLQQPATAGR